MSSVPVFWFVSHHCACLNSAASFLRISLFCSHAGCDCTEDWSGPHCELRVTSENQEISTSTSSNTPKEATKARDSQNAEMAVLVLLVLGFLLLAAIFLSCFCLLLQHRKQRAGATESTQFIDGEGSYRDEPNISPHRDSVADPFPKRFHSSSSDPFASMVAEQHEQTRQASRNRYPVMSLPANEKERLEHVEIC